MRLLPFPSAFARLKPSALVFILIVLVPLAFATPPATERVSLQLKWHHQFQFAGYYAAQAKGYYTDEGLDVTILEGGENRPPLATVLSGKAQFGVGDTDVLLARMHGEPIVVCAAIFQHSPYVLMSRRDRAIRTPADLVGATVMLSDDQGDGQFRAMMIHEGLDPKKVRIVPHSWDLTDLIERRIDVVSAYATVEPAQLRARGVEPALLRSVDYGVDFYGDTLFTTEMEVAAHPQRTAAFVRASLKGWEYAMNHPDEIAALILKMDGVGARHVTSKILLGEAEAMNPYILSHVVEIGHMNPGRWQHIAEIFASLGMAPPHFNLTGFQYDPNPSLDPRVLHWAAGIGAILVIGSVLVIVWNFEVRRRVRARTRELQDEVNRRRQIEQELVSSDERFRQLADNISEVFWVTDFHTEKLLYVSPAYEKVWGRSCASAYQSPDDWHGAILPEDRANVTKAAKTLPGNGEYNVTYRIVAADSGAVRWIHDRAYPVRNAAGEIYRIVGIAQDITEGKQAELRLKEQASLLDKSRDSILVRDLNHRITYWNRRSEQIYGWTAEEVIGRSVLDLTYREVEPFNAAMRSVVQKGSWDGEIAHYTKDGRQLIVESRWTLMQGEGGRPDTVLCINTDVTQRKELEKQFLRVQRMESIGTLASGVAHDLNNVLAPILMSIALLKLKVPDNETVQKQLNQLGVNTERGAHLVKQLLIFGRGLGDERILVQVKHVAREIAEIVETTFPKNIEFKFTYGQNLQCVLGDPTQLHQILLNLCVNARDAMPRGGHLLLDLENIVLDESATAENVEAKPGPYVVMTVADSGTGIPAAIREKIFDPFFTTKDIDKGTGLGLSTTLAIVKSHDGFLNLTSEENVGTTFKIYLPASAETTVPPAAVEPTDFLRGNNELILVVDDEKVIRDVARLILERFGYRVLLADNGTQAVAQYAVHQTAIAAVITDMAMPIMDGPATILALRGINPKVRIIACSGHAPDTSKNDALAIGASISHFIPKPYTAETLLKTIRAVIEENSHSPFDPGI